MVSIKDNSWAAGRSQEAKGRILLPESRKEAAYVSTEQHMNTTKVRVVRVCRVCTMLMSHNLCRTCASGGANVSIVKR